MHLSPLSTLIVAVVLSGHLALSFSDDSFFPNCHRTFDCGSLRNISYPFTGGDLPDHCGLPEFRLTCRDNSYAELTVNSVTYRVLRINQTQKSLVLARSDLWSNTCPHRFVNSTFDPVFSPGSENQVLTLVYGCFPLRTYKPANEFSCIVSGVNATNAFYLVGPVPVDPILLIITKCNVTVTVPVDGDAAEMLTANQTTLADTLMKGFSVNYADPYSNQCSNCTYYGDLCGFDLNSSEPICICGDRRCNHRVVLEGKQQLLSIKERLSQRH
ncbi:hypothetical protein NMG60_11006165 [Bertholletia excelsa]